MKKDAHDAIDRLWRQTVKARALCPYMDDNAIGISGYKSPSWYQAQGATYFVNLAKPLTSDDAVELTEIGGFINRSFVVSMAAIVEANDVVPFGISPDLSVPGGEHVRLMKQLRNRFAHGEWEYDPSNQKHRDTRVLLERLFPEAASKAEGFVLSIDIVLEPLKDAVLAYIGSSM